MERPALELTEDEFGAAAAEAPTTPPDRYTTLEHLAMHERGMRDQLCVLMEAVAA